MFKEKVAAILDLDKKLEIEKASLDRKYKAYEAAKRKFFKAEAGATAIKIQLNEILTAIGKEAVTIEIDGKFCYIKKRLNSVEVKETILDKDKDIDTLYSIDKLAKSNAKRFDEEIEEVGEDEEGDDEE